LINNFIEITHVEPVELVVSSR